MISGADASTSSDATTVSRSGATASDMLDALWAEVVGQPQLVEDLRTAAADPVQAYLLVGPVGSGKRAAATAFAAELLSRGLDESDAQHAIRLAGAMAHPSIHLIERQEREIGDVARDVIRAAARAPAAGHTQVFLLDDLDLVVDLAPRLLKAIEEPEAATVFVISAEEVSEGLITIASRCARYPLSPVPEDAVRDRLTTEGIEPEVAALAARSAEGSLSRARLLAADPGLVARRSAWRDAQSSLDGTGATLCEVADALLGLIDGVLEPLTAKHAEEVATFDEMVEITGDRATGRRKAMEKRHKREARRLRADELISGALALLGSYRRSAAQGAGLSSGAYVQAASAVQQFTDAIRSNANESLALRTLLLQLDAHS